MEKGLVSCIIPTYKRSDSLISAINSVLNQTYKNIEVIVVDDNEPNDEFSIEVQEKLKTFKDPRVIYVQQERHVNGAAARNRGISESKGEYVAFLDDDDTWIKEKLEKQIETFEKNPEIGLVTTGVYYNYINENVIYESIPNAVGDVSKKILISNCVGGTQAMVKKSILDDVGGFDEKLKALQDYDLWIRVCQLTKVATVKEPYINYFNYRGTKQVSQVTKNYEIAFNYISEKYSKLLNSLTTQDKKRRKNANYLLIANKAMRNSDKKTAIKFTLKAFKVHPSLKAILYSLMVAFDYKTLLKGRKLFRI